MSINDLIEKLNKLKIELGGETEVLMSFNGCTNSWEFLNITEVDTTGFFLDSEGEVYHLGDYEPEVGDKVKKMVNLYSNRDKFNYQSTF